MCILVHVVSVKDYPSLRVDPRDEYGFLRVSMPLTVSKEGRRFIRTQEDPTQFLRNERGGDGNEIAL